MFEKTRSSRRAQCKRILISALVLWSAATATVAAHDFWIEPTGFHPRVGERVALRLQVGQEFKGDPALYVPEQFERYVYSAGDQEYPVTGQRGDDPAGSFIAGSGRHVVGFHSTKFEVRFDSEREFEEYLAKEGLERNLVAARAGVRGGILEIYSRQAKSLIGEVAAGGAPDRAFGFPLELIAETDPYRSSELRLRLLYLGKPLEGALLVAFNKAEPLKKLKARTDRDGRATLQLARAGVWLVTSVHMIPRPWYARGDWESLWASLTFERPR